ncbi:hypothetical protein ASPZODRAFT_59941 [Penicilliopsis zonata CBS 506.65]|uniref:Major facilitator superfamily (MFS) profile domain-containing protein n=1 Tax=Penicilliopsis zonata CBS 506.65 TaxID=1073090 RepID=A0A1L9SQF1_9EURO|nr:hypothetical protein ASPZODRAFT_59941 [Penicilliopsis zonata CBS 506.65]OJJ49327.1 hypothetical protein ASPZODRAFT_59941 [Penicilliopsis zonata CBS 506.65]
MSTSGTDSQAIQQQQQQHQEQDLSDTSDLDLEVKPVDASDLDVAPDGGSKAWLVAAGAWAVLFSCMGFANSFGTFEEYYLANQLQNEPVDNVSWIGSLSTFLQFAAGMVSGPLFDRYGAKVIRPAAILYIFAIMMLSLCKQYWQIMLVQGILMGIAMGFLQVPSMAAVPQYFDKKRAAALGVVISGSSVGGIVLPIALSKMLNASSLGFGWSVRVIGFLLLPFVGFACVTVEARLPPRKSDFLIPSAFKEPRFVLTISALFFAFFGMFTPFFYMPTYAVTRGMDETLAGYLPSILNAVSTFGRIIPGVLADKYGRYNTLAIGTVASGIIICCMDLPKTNAGIIVYEAIYGFASGTILSGAAAAFSTCPRTPQEFGTYMGMGFTVSASAALVGPPVNGVLVDTYGGYSQVSILSGVVCIFGGLIAFYTKTTSPQGLWGNV